jgi:hypothetical protein
MCTDLSGYNAGIMIRCIQYAEGIRSKLYYRYTDYINCKIKKLYHLTSIVFADFFYYFLNHVMLQQATTECT